MSRLSDRFVGALNAPGSTAERVAVLVEAIARGDTRADLYQRNAYFHQWVDATAAMFVALADHAADRYGTVGSDRYDAAVDEYASGLAHLVHLAVLAAMEAERRRSDMLDAWLGTALIMQAFNPDGNY